MINKYVPIKSIKKAFYRGRIRKFRRLAALMAAAGMALSVMYIGRVIYTEYASARVHLVLTYPEIAESCYPDGERFTYYELTDDSRIEATLKIMREKGMYESYTVEDIKDNLYLYSYLNGSANAVVSSERSEGNDYSYVANEYRITYIQPHDYKNRNFFIKIFSPDYSCEFLEALAQVNKERFAEVSGGIGGFRTLAEIGDLSGCDYKEEIGEYRARVNAVISCLKELESNSPGFVSDSEDTALTDMIASFELLSTNKLDGISSFIESSGISRDSEVVSNKLRVNIENNLLRYNRYSDRASNNTYAMENYDHTFTENLINVVRDETQGLYQARPKTAFDTVVTQKHEAEEFSAEYAMELDLLNNELARYSSVEQSGEEYERLCARCDEYLAGLRTEYQELADSAISVVEEYYNETNRGYLTADITERELFTSGLVVNAGIMFALGAVIAFIVAIAFSVVRDGVVLRRKKKLLESIKQSGAERGIH